MIQPYVITADQVKTFLSLSDTTYDTQIETFIPSVSDDLTRRHGICNQDFLLTGTADTAGSTTLSSVSLSAKNWDALYIGSVIYVNGESGVIESFDSDAYTITLEESLTNTATGQKLYIRNIPYGAKDTIAKMIMYKIGDDIGNVDISSESIGGVSITYEIGDIDNFGYPTQLTKALRTIRKPRFF